MVNRMVNRTNRKSRAPIGKRGLLYRGLPDEPSRDRMFFRPVSRGRAEDVLRRGVGDRERLDRQLLLRLQGAELGGFFFMSASTRRPTPELIQLLRARDEIVLQADAGRDRAELGTSAESWPSVRDSTLDRAVESWPQREVGDVHRVDRNRLRPSRCRGCRWRFRSCRRSCRTARCRPRCCRACSRSS